MEKINRIEVIDETGRIFVLYLTTDQKAEIVYQDNGQTVKIFVKKAE